MQKSAGNSRMKALKPLIMAGLLFFYASQALADQVMVAVASNFTRTMKTLAPVFYRQSGHDIRAVYASSGKLYAQIVNGAPFAVFLSADEDKPRRLEQEGLGVPGSRFVYARGRLVLWSARKHVDSSWLESGDYRRLAIANPRFAPYGVAAMQVLQSLGIRKTVAPHLVNGENISQTWQFVKTGNADAGLVAASQLVADDSGYSWQVPVTLYEPIRQAAVLLKNGADNDGARAFMRFLCSKEAKAIMDSQGYDTGADTCR